jgi:hypothetical protein
LIFGGHRHPALSTPSVTNDATSMRPCPYVWLRPVFRRPTPCSIWCLLIQRCRDCQTSDAAT